MKKAIVTLCAILAVSTSLMAAGHVDSVRYLTTKAGQNWFITAEGTANWWKGSLITPADFNNYNKINAMAFGGGISVGKWINHNLAIRVAYDINGAHSYIYGGRDKITSIQCLYDEPKTPVEGEIFKTSFKYHNLHGDVMFSPVDFFQGYYNPNRIYTPVIYVGMGCAAASDRVFVLPSLINNIQARNEENSPSFDINNPKKTREALNFELSFDAGLMNNFRLNDYLDLFIDLKYSLQRWTLDSWHYEYNGTYYNDGTQAQIDNDGNLVPDANGNMPKTIRPNRVDQNFAVGLGLTWYLGGRIYELPYNYEKEKKEMNERIKNLEDELAAVPVPVVAAPTDTVFVNVSEIEAISYPFSIFFNLDSYQLMSKRDLVNLRELAKVAKEQGYKLRLRGSADSATATPSYNQRLSENRCRKIQEELINMGFPEEDIVLEPVGGVKELDPTEFDRRVLIDIIKYNDK